MAHLKQLLDMAQSCIPTDPGLRSEQRTVPDHCAVRRSGFDNPLSQSLTTFSANPDGSNGNHALSAWEERTGSNGAGEGSRTLDLRFTKPLLCH